MLKEVDERARKSEAIRKIEPYYNDLYKQKMVFGRCGSKVVYINGTAQPVGLARLILKGWQKLCQTDFVPLRGNYTPSLAAKLQCRLIGTGKGIIRRRKE